MFFQLDKIIYIHDYILYINLQLCIIVDNVYYNIHIIIYILFVDNYFIDKDKNSIFKRKFFKLCTFFS